VEVLSSHWLREMASLAIRPDTGCVGAKLLYANRTIQHAGIVLQDDPLAMHVFRAGGELGLGQDANLAGVRSYLAVTAACMAVRRSVFHAVGGFEAERLKIAYNDVDLCLRLDEAGYRNVCTPFATLLHLESATRTTDASPAMQETDLRERSWLLTRWLDRFSRDPYSHPQIRQDWNRGAQLLSSRQPRHTLAR
jgi:GT2 family glycosyltransferase